MVSRHKFFFVRKQVHVLVLKGIWKFLVLNVSYVVSYFKETWNGIKMLKYTIGHVEHYCKKEINLYAYKFLIRDYSNHFELPWFLHRSLSF